MVFSPELAEILEFYIVYMNQHAMSFNLICHIQFSDLPVFFRFPDFPADPETEIRIFGYRWNP